MPTEFQVAGQTYRATRLDVLKQAQLVRRLLPVVSALAGLSKLGAAQQAVIAAQLSPGAPQAADGAGNAPAAPEANLQEVFQPIADALAGLPDEQFQYIFSTCMSAAQKQQGDRWVTIWSPQAQRLQFDDIGLPESLQIIIQVIGENLSGFFPGGSSSFSELLSKAQK